MCKNIESLCCTLETKIILYVNYNSIKKVKYGNKNKTKRSKQMKEQEILWVIGIKKIKWDFMIEAELGGEVSHLDF